MSGCFSGGAPADTSASATSAAETEKPVTTSATEAESTPAPSAAVVASEDEPSTLKAEKPFVIAVNGVNGDYTPFAASSDFTDLVNRMTGASLAVRTRSGAFAAGGSVSYTEEFNGTRYSYDGICDITRSASGDTTVYDMKIRPGVRFSDGEVLDADDVIFTMYLHLDPSYDGSFPLQDTGIAGARSYRYDSTAADDLTPEKISEVLSSDGMKAVIREKIVIPTLNTQYDAVKSMYGDSAYSVYTSAYPRTEDLFAFFYSIDGSYSAKGKDKNTVISEIADMYGGNYRLLGGMTVGDETIFDETVTGLAVEYITLRRTGSENSADRIRSVEGIQRISQFELSVTVSGSTEEFENALCGMTVLPLHEYGNPTLYRYENGTFGFIKGKANELIAGIDKFVGAGAYTVSRYDNGVLELSANTYYYRGTPGISTIQLKECAESGTAQMIADGEADAGFTNGSAESYEAINAANKSIEKIYSAVIETEGYGYIGINANTVKVGDPFSDRSYALRKGIATAIAFYKRESVTSYYGGNAETTDYPLIRGVTITSADEGYVLPYSRDADGNPIFTPEMNEAERREAVKNACAGFFRAAGCTMSADGTIAAAPSGSKAEYTAAVVGGGTGSHPAYLALTKASELLAELGMKINVVDLTDAAVLYDSFTDNSNEIWAGAWTNEPLTTVYVNSYYGADSTKMKLLIKDAEAASPEDAKALYMKVYDKSVNAYAVEIPMYKRSDCTVFSALRVDTSTITPDMTESYDWTFETDKLRLK